MNSAGRSLVFTKANVQGQFLQVYSYEFHSSINAAFTLKLYLWFSIYYGVFLVLLKHFFMTNHQNRHARVEEMCSCVYE